MCSMFNQQEEDTNQQYIERMLNAQFVDVCYQAELDAANEEGDKKFDEWFESLTPEQQKEYVEEMRADSMYDDGPAVYFDGEHYCEG